MSNNTYAVVTVILEDREDGGLFVHSKDLPGLILSGSDKLAVCDCIAPAIQALLTHEENEEIFVHSETPLPMSLAEQGPRRVNMHVQRFIVERRAAA